MEDASLEDFLGGSETEGGDADREAAGSEETGGDGSGQAEGSSEPSDESGPEHTPREDPSATGARATAEAEVSSAGNETAAIGTFEFTPSGAQCVACGGHVERRWRDERGLVCASCKSW